MSITCGRITSCEPSNLTYSATPITVYYSAEVVLVCDDPSTVDPVTIIAGTYTSTVSQTDADAKAVQAANDLRFTNPCS